MSLTFSISIFSPSKGNVSPYLGFLISKYLTIDMLLPLCLNLKPTPFLPLHRHTCTPILLSKNQTFPLANERHSVVKLRTMEWLLSVELQREEKFHLSHLPSIHPSPHQSSLQLPYHNPRPNREIRFPPPAPEFPVSHLSWNTLIDLPSPTLHFAPISITFLALRIHFQAYEPQDCLASKMLPFGKYFGLKTRYKSEFLSWISRHIYFPKIASLNFASSLKHNPPSLVLQSVSQFFQWIFLCSPHCRHQIFLISISMSLQRPNGRYCLHYNLQKYFFPYLR